MHPDLLESLVSDRISELRGGRSRRSVPAVRGSSRRWASTGKAGVGRLFVRLGTSLIGESVAHQVRQQSRQEPACITR
jgi:hypothetical protein